MTLTRSVLLGPRVSNWNVPPVVERFVIVSGPVPMVPTPPAIDDAGGTEVDVLELTAGEGAGENAAANEDVAVVYRAGREVRLQRATGDVGVSVERPATLAIVRFVPLMLAPPR